MVQGGHVRVGFEDNVFIRKGELAKSNADLVKKMANIAKELERPIADPSETRKILGLKKR
jgi:3-keto-5-aminohexanoate cleavage enzyme